MRVPSAKARPLTRPRGAINFVGLLMLLALAAGAYLAWVWIPIVYEHQNVERVVREHVNLAVKNRDDGDLVRRMTEALGRIATVNEVSEDGRVRPRPAIDVRPQDVTWERRGQMLHVAFGYVREIEYPYIGRTQERYFSVDLTADISLPKWGGP